MNSPLLRIQEEMLLERTLLALYNQFPPQKPVRALIFQGGGSLGAYECGVFEVLCNHIINDTNLGPNEQVFDIIAGTSIGAVNAIIIANHLQKKREADPTSNPRDRWLGAPEALRDFWKKLQIFSFTDTPAFSKMWRDFTKPIGKIEEINWLNIDPLRDYWCGKGVGPAEDKVAMKYYSADVGQFFGVPSVFTIRPRFDGRLFDNIADFRIRYDNEPLQSALKKEITEPIKMSLGQDPHILLVCVDVLSGDTVTFDSVNNSTTYGTETEYKIPLDGLELKHVLACMDLPVSVDFITLEAENLNTNKHERRTMWDGALLNNTPMRQVMEYHRKFHRSRNQLIPPLEIYITDLFPKWIPGTAPEDNDFVMSRMYDLMYQDKTSSDEDFAHTMYGFQKLVISLEALLALGLPITVKNLVDNILNRPSNVLDENGNSLSYRDLATDLTMVGRVIRVCRMDPARRDITNKYGDYSLHTISQLIEQGKNDAELLWDKNTKQFKEVTP